MTNIVFDEHLKDATKVAFLQLALLNSATIQSHGFVWMELVQVCGSKSKASRVLNDLLAAGWITRGVQGFDLAKPFDVDHH